MEVMETIYFKITQLMDLLECIEDALEDVGADSGSTPAINKGLNLLGILSEQLADLAELTDAAQRKKFRK